MVIAGEVFRHLCHGIGGYQPPFIGNRVSACMALHAIDNYEIFIIGNDDTRHLRVDGTRVTSRVTCSNGHRRCRLADGNDCAHRGCQSGHRVAGQAGGMASIESGSKGRTSCLLPALQSVRRARHQITGSIRSCPAAKALAFSTTLSPIAVRLSTVADPRCGKRTVLRAASMAGLISGSP